MRMIKLAVCGVLFAFLLCLCLAGTASAQTFIALDASGKPITLERQAVTFKTKVTPGLFSASATSSVEIKPGRSPVRLPATTKFIVQGHPANPAAVYELRILNSAKKHREIPMSRAHGSVFGATANSLDSGEVPTRFEENDASSYRISTLQPLPPGEYALSLRGDVINLYCFGVD
jgi:hypothetical protein